MPKLELQMPKPDKPELNKIKRQLFGLRRAQPCRILNFGHCDLPFDFAQGGGELVEPFGI